MTLSKGFPMKLIAPIRGAQALLNGFRACQSDAEKVEFFKGCRPVERNDLKAQLTTDELNLVNGIKLEPWYNL